MGGGCRPHGRALVEMGRMLVDLNAGVELPGEPGG
jgi:hypothetical protein